jgi:hypothetical protein
LPKQAIRLWATVEGTVTDVFSEPVAGVHIYLSGDSICDITDENGEYALPFLCAGMHDIRFEPQNSAYRDTIVPRVPTTLSITTTLDVRLRTTTAIDEAMNPLPSKYVLYQNYPNPFNAVTTINFSIPEPGLVTLKIYDLPGREITTLFNCETPAGYHAVRFDASNLAGGVYFYHLETGNLSMSRKMILMK